VTIPSAELEWRFSTSGGPGGQHANRSATRVTVEWNIERSPSLTEQQRAAIKAALRGRIDSFGTLRVSADEERSQLRNREAALDRMESLVRKALIPRKKRTATAPTRAAKERRLQEKKRRSEIKQARRSPEL
jgi:ribosome-associated protein